MRVERYMDKDDFIVMPISNDELEQARKDAVKLDSENDGRKTMDGGKDKDVKGCLGQLKVHQWLDRVGIPHLYSPPYQERLFGDSFDIKIYDEIYDVKCRGWWYEKAPNYMTFYFGEHEKKFNPDYYIMTTVDRDWKNIYIAGALSHSELWKNCVKLTEEEAKHTRFPTAGKVKVNVFKPLLNVINHVG